MHMYEKYKCSICGTIYDPAKGDSYENIGPGTESPSAAAPPGDARSAVQLKKNSGPD